MSSGVFLIFLDYKKKDPEKTPSEKVTTGKTERWLRWKKNDSIIIMDKILSKTK